MQDMDCVWCKIGTKLHYLEEWQSSSADDSSGNAGQLA